MDNDNSTRAGRSIDNLDDRRNAVPTDPGHGSPHGRRMPHYDKEIGRNGQPKEPELPPSHK
jgi:hypothetical protein